MEQIKLQDTNGFLGNKYQNVVNNIKSTYKEWFALSEQVNELIYNMYNDFCVNNQDVIGMYLVTCFCKVHKSFQSCFILYSYGLEDEVRILFRTMLESFIIADRVKNDNDIFYKLLKNQDIEDSQKINILIDNGTIKDKEKIKINYKEKTSISELIQGGAYKSMYIIYSYLSSYIHINLRTLEENYITENGDVTTICISPSVNDICFILTEIIGLMLSYIELVINYSKKDYTDYLNELKKAHKRLQEQS